MSDDDEVVARALGRVGATVKEKWRLDRLIGIGGMAVVYAATHRNKKRVAIKMLLPELSGDEDVRTRFVREGYVANTVAHPGAVSVLDDDVTEDGLPFLVMDLLEGETLEAFWQRKNRQIEPQEALVFANQLLDVLGAAHAKGVVHRDIKPENLFLTHDAGLKVLDFGIAHLLEGRKARKRAADEQVLGTPAFMAPEQAQGRWDKVDGRSDLYSVGATLFALLTGHYVHEGAEGDALVELSATERAPKIGTRLPELAPAVASIVDRALAFDPKKRWSDAREMQNAVRATLEAMTAAPPSAADVPPASSGPEGQLAARTMELEARTAELARVAALAGEINQRLEGVRVRVAALDTELRGVRREREALEERFRRRVAERAESLGEARKEMHKVMAEFATRAMGDRGNFGPEWNEARADVSRLSRESEQRARELDTYRAAYTSYDPTALKNGLILGIIGAIVGLLIVATPFVLRLTGVWVSGD